MVFQSAHDLKLGNLSWLLSLLIVSAMLSVPAQGQYIMDHYVNLNINRRMGGVSLQRNLQGNFWVAGTYNYMHELSQYNLYPDGFFRNLGAAPGYGPILRPVSSSMPMYKYEAEVNYITLPLYNNFIVTDVGEYNAYFKSGENCIFESADHLSIYRSNENYKWFLAYDSEKAYSETGIRSGEYYISDNYVYYLDATTPGHTNEYIYDAGTGKGFIVNLFGSSEDAFVDAIRQDSSANLSLKAIDWEVYDKTRQVLPNIANPANKTIISSSLIPVPREGIPYLPDSYLEARKNEYEWVTDYYYDSRESYLSSIPEYVQFLESYGNGNGGVTLDAYKQYAKAGVKVDGKVISEYACYHDDDLEILNGRVYPLMSYEEYYQDFDYYDQTIKGLFSEYSYYDDTCSRYSSLQQAVSGLILDHLSAYGDDEIDYSDIYNEESDYYSFEEELFNDEDWSDDYVGFKNLLGRIDTRYRGFDVYASGFDDSDEFQSEKAVAFLHQELADIYEEDFTVFSDDLFAGVDSYNTFLGDEYYIFVETMYDGIYRNYISWMINPGEYSKFAEYLGHHLYGLGPGDLEAIQIADVPEPATVCLLLAGGLFMIKHRRRPVV